MNNIYLINEKVRFIVDQHRLEPVGEQGAITTLNVPVSRCLLLLLQRVGRVISQQEFVYEVWESKGQFANANTYFQNIHLLRKALKTAGIKDAVIKTIPKEGLMFVGKLTLLQEDNPESLIEGDLAKHITIPSTHLPPASVSIDAQANSFPKKYIVQKARAHLKVMALAGLLLMMLFSVFTAYKDINKNKNFFANYVAIGDVNLCTVYSNKKFVLRASKEYVNFFLRKNITCTPGQVAYIAINPDETRVFIHICDGSISNTNSCLTKVFLEPRNEK